MDAFYYKHPTAADLVDTKYTLADFEGNRPKVDVWDENWDVLAMFRSYASQWRIGPCGPMALDYGVFQHAMERKGITGDEYDEWIDKLSTIENAALKHLIKPS